MVHNTECAFDPTDTAGSPFQWKNASGGFVSSGTLDPTTGICIPDARWTTCSDPSTRSSCCGTTKAIDHAYGAVSYASLIAFILAQLLYKRAVQPRVTGWLASASSGDGNSAPALGGRRAMLAKMFKGRGPHFKWIIMGLSAVQLLLTVAVLLFA